MTDVVSSEKRSQMMSGIRSKDTQPEMIVRRALHARGFRYRLHVKDLPGKPDLVFPRYRSVLLIHGCFWHGHDCHLFKVPGTRTEFWLGKIGRNRERDAEVKKALTELGWRVLEVWECELRAARKAGYLPVVERVAAWLSSTALDNENQAWKASGSISPA
ncbi:very short patch repair endonuclease [Pseudomonas sp. MAP12]|uniref:Very short patch repair endonuclease n=1 Tax=Geopseudomonas aromaticivorans TaxID=2849492 RepID=A0ABS6MY09_9GAMM|nr:very short patch repair endonuclease [Pseudomonas aromaticivorans]MBV2133264.1 very short patch repair endonuclease [Pseudomonas aromaticivorans]